MIQLYIFYEVIKNIFIIYKIIKFKIFKRNIFYMEDYLFSSESVSEGHPDKVADQISDNILDAVLEQDPLARVAAETLVNTGLVVLAGEITTKAKVNYMQVVRDTIKKIGYDDSALGFDYKSCAILNCYDNQSVDIAQGVDTKTTFSKEQGAGDQGLMFGFATDETEAYMPFAIYYAHKLVEKQSQLRKSSIKQWNWLKPDAKSQVTCIYDGKTGNVKSIDSVVLSTQHSPDISLSDIRESVIEEIIKKVLPTKMLKKTKYLINPTGRFVQGGPHADCGLTGRKIIVDTYGGAAPHGGGAFSGKDPTKVDRSGSYIGRYIAKNIVAASIARQCQIQLSYAIGIANPISISIDTFGTSKYSEKELIVMVKDIFDLTPKGIIDMLDLRRPIYGKTSVYGHFGRDDPDFTWERLDKVSLLK